MEHFYKRIRQLREDNDLSQRQIASILNMPQTQYLRYEQGKRDIPTETLRKLCEYYGVSADYILELPNDLYYPE